MSTSSLITDRFHAAKTSIVGGPMERSLVRDKIIDSACDIPGERNRVIYEDSSALSPKTIPREYLLDRMLYFAQKVVAYAFGITVGIVVGSLTGRYIAGIRAESLRHTIDFFDPNQLQQWHDMPWIFARTGAVAGVLFSLAAMRIIEGVFLTRTIVSLYEKQVTEPVDIARILGRSVRQIKRKMNKLARKGVIGAGSA